MKRQLLTAMAVVLSVCGYAQTKGTNTLGFGVGIGTTKIESSQITDGPKESKIEQYSLGYGHFITDNNRIGVDFYYGRDKNENTNILVNDRIGGNLNYQHYYPLINKLYAFAGGMAGYGRFKQKVANGTGYDQYKSDQYSVGASGGVSWFFSKRFALETTLLSANMFYENTEISHQYPGQFHKSRNTNFNLNTQGSITELNFKIYLLF